ncbi:hypothetical protein CPB86DRAFT_513634 [Serendipita vermifera]|nr:hypothetical protein CPB86DRAFT_513634 [Serendipita vermifera]
MGQPLQTAAHTSNMRPMAVPQMAAPYAAPNLIIPLPQVTNSSAETHARISPVPSPERNTAPAANPVAPNPGQPISVTGPSLPSKSVDKPMQNVPQQRTTLQHPIDGSSKTGPAPAASTSQLRQPVISIPGAGASSSSTGKFSLAQAIRAVYEDPSGNTVLPPIIEPARKKRAGTPKSSQKHTPSPIPLPLPTKQAPETPTSAELKASTETKPVEADQESAQISNGTSREPSTDEPIDVSTFFENSELTPSNHTSEEDRRVTLTDVTPQATANIPQSEEPKENTVIPQSATPRQGSVIDLDKSSSPASVDLQAELVVEETEKTPTPRKRKRSSQLLFLPLSPTVERATPVIKPAEPVTIFYPPPRRRFLGVQVPVIDPDPIVYGYLRDNMKVSRSSDSDTTHEGGGRNHHKKAKSRPPPLSAEDAARLTQRTCEWSSCRTTLKNLQILRHHLETVHVAGAVKSQNFQCRWRYCYKPTFDDEDELLDHLIAHAESKIYCMHADCDFVTLDYPKLKTHIATAHNGDMSSLKPIASTVWFTPPHPEQELPATATVAEAVFPLVRGHPGAHIPSRTPSPIQSSQPIPTILLSPTKQSREDSEEPKDQYSFLSPFYKPSLEFEESSIEPLDQFLRECDLLYDGQGDTTAVQRGTSVGTSDIDELNF